LARYPPLRRQIFAGWLEVNVAFCSTHQHRQFAAGTCGIDRCAVIADINRQLAILGNDLELRFTGLGMHTAILWLAVLGMGQWRAAIGRNFRAKKQGNATVNSVLKGHFQISLKKNSKCFLAVLRQPDVQQL
jgi:hypothetical protein